MNCRGHNKRKVIVENYFVKPVAHIKLLNGQTIQSDAGSDIEDSYFIFECVSKSSGEKKYINCGRPTANDFCDLIGAKLPPIFNPLKTNVISEPKGNKTISTNNITSNWNPVRKQLYNATMLLICAWNAVPNTPLFNIKDELETYVTTEPYFSRIKSINTILSKKGITMRDIIDDLSKNNNLRNYKFDLLIDKLKEKQIKQYFEHE